jgi:tRNA threonylcarbamoyladenosine biosynthesis protein TsaE
MTASTAEIVVTHSANETREWAEQFAHSLAPATVIALIGELGAGKTVIAKGLGRGLGVKEDVISPTFNYVLEYTGRLPFIHADLYRIEDAATFQAMGLDEYFEAGGVFVIEWAERVRNILPSETIWITIESPQQDGDRQIQIRRGT